MWALLCRPHTGPLQGPCRAAPTLQLRLVLGCVALQGLRDDMPTWFKNVLSMQCFMWQENMIPISNFHQGAMRMVRAGSPGDRLDVLSPKLAGTTCSPAFSHKCCKVV